MLRRPCRASAWVLLFALHVPGAASAATPQLVDRVAAVVEDDVITLRELEGLAAPRLAQAGDAAGRDPQRRRQILREVLDAEIGERMLQREIERNRERLAVSERDVEHAIDEVARLNHLNRVELQEALFKQNLTFAAYRDKMRAQLERTRLMQSKVQGRVQIKDIDVLRRCRERQRFEAREPLVCAAQVFVPLAAAAADTALAAARRQVATLAQRWQAGELPAAAVADLGCFRRGEMLEAIDEVAFGLAEGAFSAPVRSPLGLHVVRVSGKRAVATDDCAEAAVKERFRGELYQEEMQRQMVQWTEELRKKAFVEIRLEDLG